MNARWKAFRHEIYVRYRIYCNMLHWYVAEAIFWLIRPAFFDRQDWIGRAIQDLEDTIETMQIEIHDLDVKVCSIEDRVGELD